MPDGERRLAAIMFTDIVGYTSLSQRNEAAAMSLLEEHRTIVRPFFPKHNGREVKTMGDAFLVEFASALEAVRCGYDIQQALHELNAGRESERRIRVRIGIHLGDIISSGGDIYGDAVNVASRIEPLAGPGEILVTGQVYEQTRNKFEFPFVAIGRQELKNVDVPMELYKVALPWEDRGGREAGIDKKRIAVMPLVNLTGDSRDEYFSDGMTEELISAVSGINELSVISRTSAMKFKGGGKTVAEIGRELRVGTLLEGSIRKSQERIRITVQLIDVSDDKHLWSQSYDRKLEDVFSIQSEIALRIAEALKVKLVAADMASLERRQTGNIEAYSLYLQGRYQWNKRTEEGLKKAIEYFQKAIEVDPNYALAYSGAADSYMVLSQGYLPTTEAGGKAKEFALRALELNDELAEAHTSLANVLENYDWDWAGSEKEYGRAIALNPNYPTAHHWYALLLEMLGRFEEATLEIRRAEELDPLSLIIGAAEARVLNHAGKYEEALARARSLLELEPNFMVGHVVSSSIYINLKMYDKAIEELRAASVLQPNLPYLKGQIAYCQGKTGWTEEAKKVLDGYLEISRTQNVSFQILASLYEVLGDVDRMFDYLNRAIEARESSVATLRFDPDFAKYKNDPRFKDIMKRMGLGN